MAGNKKGWNTNPFGRALPGTEEWDDVQKTKANEMVMQGKKNDEIIAVINSENGLKPLPETSSKELTLGFDDPDTGAAQPAQNAGENKPAASAGYIPPTPANTAGPAGAGQKAAEPITPVKNRSVSERNNHFLLVKDIKKEPEWKEKSKEEIEAEAWKRLDANGGKLEGQKSLAELDAENSGRRSPRQFGGPQAAADARHGTREAGGPEGEAIKAGQQAGAEATLKNGLEGIGQTVAAGTAALGGANIISKGAKALPGMAMAAAPLLMGGSRETPPEMPGNKEPEYDANGWYQDENGQWLPGPNAKYNEGESPATKTGSAEPPETADEETPANEETADALNGVAPTEKDKNSLQEAAKRVLGLTGDKKKDAMKWLALAVSAAGHGWRGRTSPIVQMIIDDYQAKRAADTASEFSKNQHLKDIEKMNIQHAQEMERVGQMNAWQRENQEVLAELNAKLGIDTSKILNEQQYNLARRLDAEVAKNPDGYAIIRRAQNGETAAEAKLRSIAAGIGMSMPVLQMFLGKKGKE